MSMDFAALRAPFPHRDIEWRIGRAGKKGGSVWAKCLAYITNRAIQDRLDEVCGPENWRNEYQPGPTGGLLCGISIRVDGEWVTKWDGADNTEIEAIKGGLSGAMKRAAVQWGIGRYLYNLPEGWANVHEHGAYFGRLPKDQGGDSFKWDPPALPDWARPGGDGRYAEPEADPETGEVPDLSAPPISVTVETLKNRALNLKAISEKQALGIDRKLAEADPGILSTAKDWLELQIEKAKAGHRVEDETEEQEEEAAEQASLV